MDIKVTDNQRWLDFSLITTVPVLLMCRSPERKFDEQRTENLV
jgi:hypothetical protein